MFRDEGATSAEAWVAERFGVSAPTARALAHVAEKAWNCPTWSGSLCEGDISFDKVRAVVDVATPRDRRVSSATRPKSCTVRELAEVARTTAERARSALRSPRSRSEHDGRYLRFNDDHRTMTAQLPAESYAADQGLRRGRGPPRSPLTTRRPVGPAPLRRVHGRSWTGDSGRLATGLGEPRRHPATAPSPFFVVAHVAARGPGRRVGETSELAGELEHDGLIDIETVQRIACDATSS